MVFLLVSRDSHMSGVEPMRAETLIQKQQSSLHNSRLKGIQTGFLKKKGNKTLFLQPSVNMSVGRIWQTENQKIWQKKEKKKQQP